MVVRPHQHHRIGLAARACAELVAHIEERAVAQAAVEWRIAA
jgi:hypothetical protein